MSESSCLWCKKPITSKSPGGKNLFCSKTCADNYHWLSKHSHQKKGSVKQCEECGKDYMKNPKMSKTQWNHNRFCSVQCAAKNKRINDGMSRDERYRRRRGATKQKSPEWLEKIRITTTEGMYKPDVQEKLHSKRKPMSEKTKGKISTSLMGSMPANNMSSGKYGNVQSGTYLCSKGDQYFRSKWEANYALYLDFLVEQHQIEGWEYEVDTFLFEQIVTGTRSYTPDFKIALFNGEVEYHEVKGHMDSKSKTKLRRMMKYYPEIKMVLVDRKPYQEILKKLKGVIKFY